MQNAIIAAMDLLSAEERQKQLIEALNSDAINFEQIVLNLPLASLSPATKTQLATRMNATLIAHTENRATGREWILPLVAGPLRLSVFDLSRLAQAIQLATTNLARGRGDYATLYLMLSPNKLDELNKSIRQIIQDYTSQIWKASNRSPRAKAKAPKAIEGGE